MLVVTICFDNFSGGLAAAAFVAYLSGLTNLKFSATQYAMLSSIMLLVPRAIGGYSGVMVNSLSESNALLQALERWSFIEFAPQMIGYANFFLVTALLGLPTLTRPACSASSAAQIAAEPVAQAFSSRTAGTWRNLGMATAGSDAVKSCPTKPALKWPMNMPSISSGSRPALSSAGCTASRIICSRSILSSLPKGVWPQPTMYEDCMSVLQDDEGCQGCRRSFRHRALQASSSLRSVSQLRIRAVASSSRSGCPT